MHLGIHLRNGQSVYFCPDNLQERVQNKKLKKYNFHSSFDLCDEDDFAETLLYEDALLYYIWKVL